MRVALVAALVVALSAAGVALADSNPPAPSLTANPPNPSTSTAASFTYTDSGTITKFQCQLDSGGYSDCGTTKPSTKPYAGPLSQGSHKFEVRAVNGSKTSSATAYTWVIDSIPPSVTSINRISASPTNASSVQWQVKFSEDVTGVDLTDFNLAPTGVTGTSKTSVTGSGSTYTFTANTGSGSGTLGLSLADNDSIKDSALNPLGPGNGSFTGQVFTIDRTAPLAPTITAPAASPAWTTTNSPSATWTPAEAGGSFLCKLDGGSFAACTTPKAYSGLAQGSHTFQVEQVDAVGNTGPAASRTFQVDSIAPPVPVITGKPANPTMSASANFVFSDSEGGVSFICRLDAAASFTACSSPQPYSGLAQNVTHTFRVKAKDAAGNESTEASWTWLIDTQKPDKPVILLGPIPYVTPVAWQSTSALFLFGDSSGDVVSWQCKLDTSSFVACPDPQTYSGLAQGLHSFSVKAVDAAGNISDPSNTWSFFVDTVNPNKPTLTVFPPDPAPSQSAHFEWTDTDLGAPTTGSGIALYLCSIENGSLFPCGTGNSGSITFTVSGPNNSQHQFSVIAVDWAGNISQENKYKWKVQTGAGLPFTIGATTSTLLYPGGDDVPVNLIFSNQNATPITVTSVTMTVTGTDTVSCPLSLASVTVSQQLTGSVGPIPGGNVPTSLSTLGVPQSNWPKLHMTDTNTNQNACRGIQVTLSFTGSANG